MTPQYIRIDKDNNKYYNKNKEMTILHREDGPALEWVDGYKAWYTNGQLHREDGPAIEHGNGAKSWYKHGILHREDGPAIEWGSSKSWWLDGVKLTEQEFLLKTAKETVLTMDEIADRFGIEVSKLKISK